MLLIYILSAILLLPAGLYGKNTTAIPAKLFEFSIADFAISSSDCNDNLIFSNKPWYTSSKPYNEIIFIRFAKKINPQHINLDYDTSKVSVKIIPVNKHKTSTVIIELNAKKQQKFLTVYLKNYFLYALPAQPLAAGSLKYKGKPVLLVRRVKQKSFYKRSVTITDKDTASLALKNNFLILWEHNRLCIGKLSRNKFTGYSIAHLNNAQKVSLPVSYDDNKLTIKQHEYYFNIPDSAFVMLKDLAPEITLDIRYATENNFMHQKMYDCAQCMLRYCVAKDLAEVNKELQSKGLKLKIFDCYRPLSVQKKMWKKIHNINYVAPPSKGSMHNRGAAVDLTLTYANGQELDMGTPFDFFGPEASPQYTGFSGQVLHNRNILDSIMRKHNFRPIRTEWWHFYHIKARQYGIEDFPLPCKPIG